VHGLSCRHMDVGRSRGCSIHVGLSALLGGIYGCRQRVRSADMHGVCCREVQVGSRVWELHVMSEFLDFGVGNRVNQWLHVCAGILGTGRRSVRSLCVRDLQKRVWKWCVYHVWS
jgi:hypothetical protein